MPQKNELISMQKTRRQDRCRQHWMDRKNHSHTI